MVKLTLSSIWNPASGRSGGWMKSSATVSGAAGERGGGIADIPVTWLDQALGTGVSAVPVTARTRRWRPVSGDSPVTVYEVAVVVTMGSVSSNTSSTLICTSYPVAPSAAVHVHVIELVVVADTWRPVGTGGSGAGCGCAGGAGVGVAGAGAGAVGVSPPQVANTRPRTATPMSGAKLLLNGSASIQTSGPAHASSRFLNLTVNRLAAS